MKLQLAVLSIFSSFLIACQSGDPEAQGGVLENTETKKVADVIDTVAGEAIFMKVSSPDEVLVELNESIGAHEKFGAYISVDEDNELLITHLRHEDQHHLIFDQASDVIPLSLIYNNDGPIEPPFRVSIRHRVKDYETWKWLYDGDEKSRENAGMVLVQMACVDGDPNDLFMVFGIPDIARAREMMDKPNLKNKMKSGGVIGDPEVRFWRPVSND